ncbi:tripartite tricarboxylate transporter permease [Ancylobacter dichloromethanicus]
MRGYPGAAFMPRLILIYSGVFTAIWLGGLLFRNPAPNHDLDPLAADPGRFEFEYRDCLVTAAAILALVYGIDLVGFELTCFLIFLWSCCIPGCRTSHGCSAWPPLPPFFCYVVFVLLFERLPAARFFFLLTLISERTVMGVLFDNFIPALHLILTPENLLIMLVGIVVGTILGALPGFGAAQALALMFPFTFSMTPEAGTLFFIAIYAAAEYGGSIPAILIRTPGTTAAAITVLDGYPMAQQGKAGRALKISLYTGVVGSIASSFIFLFAASSLAWIGLQFGPSEMFAVGVFGLSIIGSFFGENPVKGFIATGVGLFLATVGSSGFSGLRFTFGQAALLDGVPLLVVIIGVMAMPEAFDLMLARKGRTPNWRSSAAARRKPIMSAGRSCGD